MLPSARVCTFVNIRVFFVNEKKNKTNFSGSQYACVLVCVCEREFDRLNLLKKPSAYFN